MSEEVRRAFCLVAFWDGPDFVVENYVARRRTAVAPALLQVLPTDRAFEARADVEGRLGRHGLKAAHVADLVEQHVLLCRGTDAEHRDRAVHMRWLWGHEARFFHFASGDVAYETDLDLVTEALGALAATDPPPSPYLERAGAHVVLPDGNSDDLGELGTALASRRTRRRFSRASVALEQLATVLRWTWGATEHRSHPVLGEYVLKTSPSGGARHPTEVYVLARRVDGLRPGIYHYAIRDGSLRLIRPGLEDVEVVAAFARHDWFADAAVAFVMTAVLRRSMWKYRHAHAYRVLLLDAGHLGQTFHLVCTRLGLAPFTSAALDDAYLERLLALDTSEEIVVYGAATGTPAADSA